MIRRPFRLLLAAALCTPMALTTGTGASPDDGVTLAVLPCTNIESTFRKFYPLIRVREAVGRGHRAARRPGRPDRVRGPADERSGRPRAAGSPHLRGARSVLRQDQGAGHRGVERHEQAVRRRGRAEGQRRERPCRNCAGAGCCSDREPRRRNGWPPNCSSSPPASTSIAISRPSNGGCCEDIAFAVAIRSVDAGVVCEHFAGLHEEKQKEPGCRRRVAPRYCAHADVPHARAGRPRGRAARGGRAPCWLRFLRLDRSVADHARILSAAEIQAFTRTSEAEYLRSLRLPVTPAAAGEGPVLSRQR